MIARPYNSLKVSGQRGFNEYRWDLITKKRESDLPYFTDYEVYIKAGTYVFVLSDGKKEWRQDFKVSNRVTPFNE